jgi:hypothetical protein
VIDPEIESNIVSKVISSKIDAQFLPEGGHLLANTDNTIGVVIKDELGFGIPNLEGHLINVNNDVITTFKTNQFGIGKFSLHPKGLETYRVEINFENTKQVFNIDQAELYGVTLSLSDLNTKVALRIATNESTLNSIKGKPYKLTIHNGFEFKMSDVDFDDELAIIKYINYKDLFTGINIFTVFNENNVPLLERLFFNHQGVDLIKSAEVSYKKAKDSTEVLVSYNDIYTSNPNYLSISILPEETKSYNHHHNIISSAYLQPYVKGFIENASYYFTDINRRKEFELDNLLITQGWSSYDWNTIFNYPPTTNYTFETGIGFKATANNFNSDNFVMYPTSYNELETFEITSENKTFEKTGLFPFDGEKVRLSELKQNDKVKKSGVYLQFYPSKIPDLEKYTKVLPLKENVFFETNSFQPFLETSWTEFEQLDEVLIEVTKTQDRIEKLQNTTSGVVDVFDSSKRRMYIDFASYLRTKGYIISQNNGEFNITDSRPTTLRQMTTIPTVYINNRLIVDMTELSYYDLDLVDYIIINKRGYGEGARGAGGVIRIFTDPTLLYKNNPQLSSFQEFDIPLTFTTPTTFYAPKYTYYESSFYKEYGAIEWLPKLSVDEKGNISFKISNQVGSNMKLFIEGTANNGGFISEVKTVRIE